MLEFLRHLAIQHQGFGDHPQFAQGLAGAQQIIEHLGYVQIDTISVVERAHHHVLWSRLPDYKQDHLNQLVQQQTIFEYWAHAAAYLPIHDYRYALPRMNLVREGKHRYFNRGDSGLMQEILARVKAEGQIRLRDLEQDQRVSTGGWWNSSSARRSLEQLFMQGDLMISERQGMQKIYRLTEDCLPTGLDLSYPSQEEYALYLLKTSLRSHGVVTLKQLLHLQTGQTIRATMTKVLNEQIEAGLVMQLENIQGQNYYVNPTALMRKPHLQSGIKFLSPFDPLVIHRERLNALFNFDYKIECYVPAPKRMFGYFCLPILFQDQFIGRIDCKAHRASQTFEVISLHLEEIFYQNKQLDRFEFLNLFKNELQTFVEFNQCPKLDENTLKILNQTILNTEKH